ncbi:hypothetical protein JW859_04090 [bacterium]|nr:hypothetical protein [bacterium]
MFINTGPYGEIGSAFTGNCITNDFGAISSYEPPRFYEPPVTINVGDTGCLSPLLPPSEPLFHTPMFEPRFGETLSSPSCIERGILRSQGITEYGLNLLGK